MLWWWSTKRLFANDHKANAKRGTKSFVKSGMPRQWREYSTIFFMQDTNFEGFEGWLKEICHALSGKIMNCN
jgi:hypothetical protein